MAQHEERRPDATNIETADDQAGNLKSPTSVRPRCRHCGHVVWHPVSILTGLGRDCRRAIERAARQVIA